MNKGNSPPDICLDCNFRHSKKWPGERIVIHTCTKKFIPCYIVSKNCPYIEKLEKINIRVSICKHYNDRFIDRFKQFSDNHYV